MYELNPKNPNQNQGNWGTFSFPVGKEIMVAYPLYCGACNSWDIIHRSTEF